MGQLTSVLLGYTDNTQTANWLVARVLSILNTSNIECLRITSLNVITYRYVYFPCIILTLYLVLTCFLSNSMFILLMLFAFFPFLAFAQLH